MDHGVDRAVPDDLAHQRLVGDLALHQRGLLAHERAVAGRKIVEDHDRLAAVEQRVGHVAADIAGAAGDQNAHDGLAAGARP